MRYNGNDITWVWLDLDDTLIDFHTNSRKALANTYHLAGLERWFESPEQWTERYEHFNYPLWDRLAKGEITTPYLRMERFRLPLVEAGMEDSAARELSLKLDPLYLDCLANEKATVKGAFELLEKLRATGVHTGILSNGFADVQHRKIRRAGIDSYIDETVLSDDIGIQKPDIRLYRHAMERSGDMCETHHLMIGDNPSTDISGALNAGWSAILLQPQHPGSARKKVPEGAASADNLEEVAEMLGD